MTPEEQVFTGPARVFECEEDAFECVRCRGYQAGDDTVIDTYAYGVVFDYQTNEAVDGFVDYYAWRLADDEFASVKIFRYRSGLEVAEVRIWETSNSRASYRAPRLD